jgi:LPS export ABC transporter protein LptC
MTIPSQLLKSHPAVTIFTALAFIALAGIVTSCQNSEKGIPTAAVELTAGFADQEIFGATVRLSQEDRPRLTLTTAHLRRFESKRLLLLEGGVHADFYDNMGLHKAVLTSREGEVEEGVNRLVAKGNVVVVSDSGAVLRSEELHYDPEVGRIEADGFVTITSPQDSLAGEGFSAATDLTDWEIKNTSGATWRKVERDTTRKDSTN